MYLFSLFVLLIIQLTNAEVEDCGCSKLTRTETLQSIEPVSQENIESVHTQHISETSSSNYIEDMVLINLESSVIGSNSPILPKDGEGPQRKVYLDPYYIDRFEVSNIGNYVYNKILQYKLLMIYLIL